jgi:polysaccharide deacetylase 2 family uncharacterized protein YibQ
MAPRNPRLPRSGRQPSRKRRVTPQKSGRGPHVWQLGLLLLGTAVVLAGLVWLARREEHQPMLPPAARVSVAGDAAAAREQVEAMLAVAAIPAAAISREPADHPRNYRISHRRPPAVAIEQLRQNLRRLSPPLVLSALEGGVLTVTDGQGRTLLTMHFLPVSGPPPTKSSARGKPDSSGKTSRLAIIMDDLGRGTHAARQLLAIPQPVTLAILPGEPHAAQVAELAHTAGREVMLHTPMEPEGFPTVNPGPDALLVGQTAVELRARLAAQLARVPHAAGANNHMGSRFTADERAMAAVMDELRARGLFFVDSLTSGASVGRAAAQRAGVPSGSRDVFLDNVAETGAITRQLRQLVAKARRNGSAIGICHPYPETLAVLRRELPKLVEQGIEFVPVSALVKKQEPGSGG